MINNESQDINLLIAQYIRNELPEEKIKMVEEWIALHSEEYAFLQSVYNDSNHVFDIDKAWNDVSMKLRFKKKNRRLSLSIWLSVAASVLLIMIFATDLLKLSSGDVDSQHNLSKVYTTNDSIMTFSLPDGSSIKLYKNSVFSYDWKDSSMRLTHLKGQAYFLVAKNPNRPFIIKTDHTEIKVLGTSFVVDTRFEDNKNLILVKDGVVNVRNLLLSKEQKLHRGDCVLSSGSGLEPYSEVDSNEYAWIEEELVFNNQTLSQVVNRLEIYFGKTITIKGDAEKCMVTATFKKQSLKDILNELQLILNLKYKEVNDEYIIFDLKCM